MTMYRFTFKITRPDTETEWPGEYRGTEDNLNYDEEYSEITKPDGKNEVIFYSISTADIGENPHMIHMFNYDSHDQAKLQEFHDKFFDNTTALHSEISYYEKRGFTVEISDVAERILPSANT